MQLSGSGYFTRYVTTLKSLLNEEHLQSSPRGHSVIALGSFIVEQGKCKASVDVSVQLCFWLGEIVEGSKRSRRLPTSRAKKSRRLPTSFIGKVWSDFHKLRFNPEIQTVDNVPYSP